MWSQEGPLFCMWKYQITITFYKAPGGLGGIIWAETTYYGPGFIDVVCLFCGQFAELMGFTVQN